MKYLALLLIIVFVGIGIFGFVVFDHKMNHIDCVRSKVDGTICPTEILNMVLHHISTLQVFSMAITSSIYSLFLLISSLSIILFLLVLKLKSLFIFKSDYLFKKFKYLLFIFKQNLFGLISWLSLLENSPTIL